MEIDESIGDRGAEDGAVSEDAIGYYQCACSWLSQSTRRILGSPISFVVFYFINLFFFVCCETFFYASITSIEKRFGFTSQHTGILLSLREVTYCTFVPWVSHYGRYGNKPRIIGVMGLVGAASAYVSAMPHFAFSLPTLNQTATGHQDNAHICHREAALYRNETLECRDTGSAFNSGAFALFVLANLLVGLGQTSQLGLAQAYIDDISTPQKSPLYIGVISAAKPLSPVLSFALGGYFSSYHHDFKDPGYGEEDVRWIGAWWLGYLLFPTILLLPSLILIFFPRKLTDRRTQSSVENTEDRPGFLEFLKELWASLKRLFHNPAYVLFLINWVHVCYLFSGFFPFLPKYLETQFSLPTSIVNVSLGTVVSFVSAAGVILGGVIQSRSGWTTRGTIMYIFLVNLLFIGSLFILLFLGCPQESILGVQIPFNASCSTDCACSDVFLPVCGDDGATYRSACLAGCTQIAHNQSYSSCSCVSEAWSDGFVQSPYDGATSGSCESMCANYVAYLFIVTLAMFFATITGVSFYTFILRVVDPRDKELSLGVIGCSASLLGFIPGPILYGSLIDRTCLFRERSCEGATGACLLYDNRQFRHVLHGVTLVLMSLSNFFIAFTAIYVWRRSSITSKQRRKTTETQDLQATPVVD